MTAIRVLDAAEAELRLSELADLLVDAVAHGASVNFLAGLTHDECREFWRTQLPGLADRSRRLFVADNAGRLVATAVLAFAHQPNAPHRAEVGKMLVHSNLRRQGLGRRILAAVEGAARDAGRTLLLLDTETGSTGDLLYRACGWTPLGTVPGHALRTDGRPGDTTLFYKRLA